VNSHDIARFLNVHVWDLEDIPIHYQEEAFVIITARRQARWQFAKDAKAMGVIDISFD
jgi:hypothetical protein